MFIGTKVTFMDEGGACSSVSSGVYEFEVSDSSVTFCKVIDPVVRRSG